MEIKLRDFIAPIEATMSKAVLLVWGLNVVVYSVIRPKAKTGSIHSL